MEIYRGAAERLVEIYDFDWKENERIKEHEGRHGDLSQSGEPDGRYGNHDRDGI